MSAWGTSLYANDSACDIRGDYVDKLRRGKTNEEVTQELIESNKDIMGDAEEEPLFWYALADTQWNYGRLLPFVKEKALSFVDKKEELDRWKDISEEKALAWNNTRTKLKEKLLSPQPPEKKVSKYRLYHCQWKLGDVFAYRLSSDYSKGKNLFGQYIVFRKVSENNYWPGHIIPVVEVYKWLGEKVPTLDFFEKAELLVQNCLPEYCIRNPNHERIYIVDLLSTSKRVIPENNLTFLGNIPVENPDSPKYLKGYMHRGVGWEGQRWNKTFERYMIDTYLAWKDFD